MTDNKPVAPKHVSGISISWNLNLFSGPKLYIECGNCEAGFKHRMPLKDHPTIICPNCYTVNRIPFVYENMKNCKFII